MAVEIKYVVIREGEEKMSFTSKKEADAYDKMLDLAEVLNDWLVDCPLTLDEAQRDEMAMWLAERKDTLHHIMKSGKLPEAEEHAAGQDENEQQSADAGDDAISASVDDSVDDGAAEKAAPKSRKAKAA
ncbi:LexA family transcriptional regulator [Enterobacter sp. 10-1]|uniref:YebG family protein n=1 Tax=Raoultella sp. 10-1 TaxID=2683201 RepID=UPI000BA496F6|nr:MULTISPECIES: YebG family protein [Enterobacteriaceae]MVT04235.1 LexA family transcriptional regulator [Raoultella sp. 10-1]PAC10339.1 LexA family transcriptional regulator [Enterobacter sp. 10-1]